MHFTTSGIDILCPVWILTEHYDTAFWSLDTLAKTKTILPSFTKNYKTSNWVKDEHRDLNFNYSKKRI